MKKCKLVYLEWVDSTLMFGWRDCKEKTEFVNVVSIGMLIAEDEDTITISTCVDYPNANCANPVAIPKCAIMKRKYIKYD